MICINPILHDPKLGALAGGIISMVVFYIFNYSVTLLRALIVSFTVAYIIYFLMGGKVLCKEVKVLNIDLDDDDD